MIKYAITTGKSVITDVLDADKYSAVKLSNNIEEAILFDKIGDAISAASKINDILGNPVCSAVSVQIPVTGNL